MNQSSLSLLKVLVAALLLGVSLTARAEDKPTISGQNLEIVSADKFFTNYKWTGTVRNNSFYQQNIGVVIVFMDKAGREVHRYDLGAIPVERASSALFSKAFGLMTAKADQFETYESQAAVAAASSPAASSAPSVAAMGDYDAEREERARSIQEQQQSSDKAALTSKVREFEERRDRACDKSSDLSRELTSKADRYNSKLEAYKMACENVANLAYKMNRCSSKSDELQSMRKELDSFKSKADSADRDCDRAASELSERKKRLDAMR